MTDKEVDELITRRRFKEAYDRMHFIRHGFNESQAHFLQSRWVEKDDFYEVLDRLDKLADRISKIEEKI